MSFFGELFAPPLRPPPTHASHCPLASCLSRAAFLSSRSLPFLTLTMWSVFGALYKRSRRHEIPGALPFRVSAFLRNVCCRSEGEEEEVALSSHYLSFTSASASRIGKNLILQFVGLEWELILLEAPWTGFLDGRRDEPGRKTLV